MALVQHISAQILTATATLDITFAAGVTVGNLIVVAVLNGNNAGGTDPSGVNWSDGSAAFTFATSSRGTNGADKVEVWYLPVTAAGKTVVRVTWPTSTATDKQAVIFEVSGFTRPTLNNATGQANGSSATPSSPVSNLPSTQNCFMVAGIITTGSGVTANPHAGNEFSAGGDITTNLNAACSLITTTTGNHQAQWDTSAATSCTNIASFIEGATAPIFYMAPSYPPGRSVIRRRAS